MSFSVWPSPWPSSGSSLVIDSSAHVGDGSQDEETVTCAVTGDSRWLGGHSTSRLKVTLMVGGRLFQHSQASSSSGKFAGGSCCSQSVNRRRNTNSRDGQSTHRGMPSLCRSVGLPYGVRRHWWSPSRLRIQPSITLSRIPAGTASFSPPYSGPTPWSRSIRFIWSGASRIIRPIVIVLALAANNSLSK